MKVDFFLYSIISVDTIIAFIWKHSTTYCVCFVLHFPRIASIVVIETTVDIKIMALKGNLKN